MFSAFLVFFWRGNWHPTANTTHKYCYSSLFLRKSNTWRNPGGDDNLLGFILQQSMHLIVSHLLSLKSMHYFGDNLHSIVFNNDETSASLKHYSSFNENHISLCCQENSTRFDNCRILNHNHCVTDLKERVNITWISCIGQNDNIAILDWAPFQIYTHRLSGQAS